MNLDLTFYALATACILLTGISKSGFGGGLGVLSVPLLSLHVSPQLAASVLMPILLAMDILIVVQYRARWRPAVVAMLLPGALLGLSLGAGGFVALDPDMVRLGIGLLALGFVAQALWVRTDTAQPTPITVFALGMLSGFASFVAHAGGPPVKGILLRQNLEKAVFVGTNTMFFFTMNAIKTVAYGAMGHLSAETLTVSLWLSPALLVGVALGTVLHRYLGAQAFVWLVRVVLAVAGVRLTWLGLVGLWQGA
ncbi:UPF0721 transmembrane protein [Jannaschia pagri]|uniref:Probable membrane transporter protein n=1 Tax=Jannaschia pagri TaxID=2829797 RepID=A0ABQ4NHH9_9RHOB|nr:MULTISPECIES: sulfite exporter TauE/SafE family protein [unclassified Jannaschia]GIT90030.1 UPF0721 transmembrane protein [Jannaschia sp. AI_61]GIT93864.1 UPF0721 transmembrane protein [Jannaschia sp. AI_62]